MDKKIILIVGMIIMVMLLSGCAKSVSEITANDDYVGETVTVKGTAQGVTQIGQLSGYVLVDSNDDKIIVATEDLPKEGDSVRVKGTLEEGIFGMGYFINTN